MVSLVFHVPKYDCDKAAKPVKHKSVLSARQKHLRETKAFDWLSTVHKSVVNRCFMHLLLLTCSTDD